MPPAAPVVPPAASPLPAAPPAAPVVPPPSPAPPPAAAPQEQGPEEALKKVVEQHLQEASPNPAGVGDCIDLAVLYLDRGNYSEAEALFARMDERRSPSTYHFVGRLGLAVTDAFKKDYRDSHAKFAELLDPKDRDNRREILNDYLVQKPEFARWVNDANSEDARNGFADFPAPQGEHHFSDRKPFRRP